MGINDIFLLIILGGFVFYGLIFGLIIALGSLVSFLAGLFFAAWFYGPVVDWLNRFFWSGGFLRLLVFVALFIIANRLVSFLFSIINKAFDIISIIPFLKSINRLAGALFGLIEGLFIIGLIFYVVEHTYLAESAFGQALISSKFAPYISTGTKLFVAMLPRLLERLVMLF